jgi:hypothetical protein
MTAMGRQGTPQGSPGILSGDAGSSAASWISSASWFGSASPESDQIGQIVYQIFGCI